MENTVFLCDNCNEFYKEKSSELICEKCNKIIKIKNGYYDFLQVENSKRQIIKKNIIKELLNEIEKNEYEIGINKFLNKYPKYKIKFLDPRFDQSVDSIFHCLGENNKRCLVLGSGFGNKLEILSHIFDEVFSVETMDELLLFQHRKISRSKINNIILLKNNFESIPVSDNFFDLIIFGESFFDEVRNYNNQKRSTEQILFETKRLLNKYGCVCFGIENNSKFNVFSEKNHKAKNQLSIREFGELIKKSGFSSKIYWTLPSMEKPYFSSNLEDGLAIKWYFKNYKNFIKRTKNQLKFKIFFNIFAKLHPLFLKILIRKFAPYFIYYCYKENIPDSIEDFILKETNFSSCFTISRRIKTVFVLIDKKGKAKFISHFKRIGKDFPEKIPIVERIFPDMANPDSRIWMETWKNGRTLNPFNHNEVIQAILWLFQFQKNSSQEQFIVKDIENEILMIKENLNKKNDLDKVQYYQWLEDYKKFLENNNIEKTAQHGDFAYANILFDPKNNEVNPVDWENFTVTGSPFRDLVGFIIRLMMQSSKNEIESFREKIQDENEFKSLILNIQKLSNNHFKCNIDLNIIIRYAILKKVAELIEIKKDSANTYIELLKILENNNFVVYREDE